MLGLGSLLSIYLWLNLIVSFKGMHDGPACDVNFHDDDENVPLTTHPEVPLPHVLLSSDRYSIKDQDDVAIGFIDMGMWLEPPKSSWKIEEKIQHKIESLEAYAIDACTNDDQKKTAGGKWD